MNKPEPASPAPDYLCLCHIVGLRYLLAGDLESKEHLDRLSERIQTINWNDPEFVRFTEEMRADPIKLTPEQAEELRPDLLALIHVMQEKLAVQDEALHQNVNFLQGQNAKLATLLDQQKDVAKKQEKLDRYGEALGELAVRMRDRLEILGDDMSKFQLPDFS